jgi:two-component system, OmpR family, response regulator TctD
VVAVPQSAYSIGGNQDNERLMRLLIVEDNETLADWLAKLLRGSNYVVDCVHDGESAAHGTDLKTYDLLIVDLALPKMSGIDVVRHIRAAGLSTPILILTAKDAVQSRVEGLDAGADDYLTKPFEVEELDARLRALLRRSNTTLKSELRFGSLSFDQNTRLFAIGGTSLHLSPREHALLETLLRRAGTTVSKEMLLESSYGFGDDVNLSAIEVHIHRLRKKLENSGVSIATLRGLGYLLRLDRP